MDNYKENKRLLTEIITFNNGETFIEKEISKEEEVAAIEFSKSFLVFAVNSLLEGRIVLWDLQTMKECFSFNHHKRISKIAFPCSEQYLLIHDGENKFYKIFFRESKSEYLFKTKSEVSSISFKPETEIFACSLYNNYPHVISIKDKPQVLHKLIDDATSSYSIKFSNDKRYLAYGNSNSELILYDASSFKLILKKKASKDSEVEIVKFGDNSRYVYTVSKEPYIKIWDIPSLTLKERIKLNEFGLNTLFYSSDSDFVLASFIGKPLIIWDLTNSKVFPDIYTETNSTDFENSSFLAEFSLDGRYLATACGFGNNNKKLKIYISKIPSNHKEIIDKYLNKIKLFDGKRSDYGVSDPQTFDDFY